MRNILLAVVAAAGLVGCVGGIETPTQPSTPPPDGVGGGTTNGAAAAEARKSFDDNVYPVISAKCAACHSSSGPLGNITGFVATNAADGYTTAAGYQALVGDRTPTGAPILTKISAGHNNLTYTDPEKSKITDWLAKELAARTSAPPTGTTPPEETPAEATIRLTKEWSGCMTLANFTAANMTAWGNMRAGNSACKTCHVNGEFGQIASDVATPFFNLISTNKYYMSQYFSVDLTQGVANAKVIINTRSFIAVGTGLAPHQEHPRFQLTNSTGLTALQKFYDLTMAAKTATPTTCGPPTLTN